MFDQWSEDRTGWARFSSDKTMRYRLARSLTGGPLYVQGGDVDLGIGRSVIRAVFLMLNPSTADALKLDPTVNECRKRAAAAGANVLEVVNLFALRSPYPADLRRRAKGNRGDDINNDAAIISACRDATIVVAAWGNHGTLGGRAERVTGMLVDRGVTLHHFGCTAGGQPKHPLARGKHRIPGAFAPIAWSPKP